MSELRPESIIIWTELLKEGSIVFTIYDIVSLSSLYACVVLIAGPGHKISSWLESWSPSNGEQRIIFSLKSFSHVNLLVDCWCIIVVSAVFHQALPHFSLILIITLNLESWLWCLLSLFLKAESFNERFRTFGLFCCNLSLNFITEFGLKEDVGSLLIEFCSMLSLVIHF